MGGNGPGVGSGKGSIIGVTGPPRRRYGSKKKLKNRSKVKLVTWYTRSYFDYTSMKFHNYAPVIYIEKGGLKLIMLINYIYLCILVTGVFLIHK